MVEVVIAEHNYWFGNEIFNNHTGVQELDWFSKILSALVLWICPKKSKTNRKRMKKIYNNNANSFLSNVTSSNMCSASQENTGYDTVWVVCGGQSSLLLRRNLKEIN